jgi:hypothetical protein
MHGPINVKSPNNTSKWQMGFNSAFKGLKEHVIHGYEAGSVCLQSIILSYNEKFPRPLSGVNDLEFRRREVASST